MTKLFLLIIISFFTSCLVVFSKDFKTLDISNGLSDNTVKCISQDKYGFMWIGTFNGLCRFDGVTFTVYRHDVNNVNSIINNHVEALLPLDDYVWVGTKRGLSCYSQKENKFYNCYYLTEFGEEKLIDVSIRDIMLCNGRVFVLTNTNKLFVLKEGKTFVSCEYGKKMSYLAITKYEENLFFAYCTEGLFLIDACKQIIVKWKVLDGHINDNCFIYYSKNQKVLYVGSGIGHEGEAFKLSPSLEFIRDESFTLKNIKSIVDFRDSVLFGLDGDGLMEMEGDTCHYYTPVNSNINSDVVYSLFVDNMDCLWIGTYRGGINFYSSNYDWFHTLTMSKYNLSNSVVTAIYPENDKLYIGLDGGGLNIYDRKSGKLSVYSRENSLIPGDNVLSICADSKYIWMAIYEKGLCRFSRTSHTFKTYNLCSLDEIVNANQVWDVRQDINGDIWIIGAVVYFFDKEKEQFTLINGIYNASGIVFDGNRIWISSASNGLYQLDMKTKKICIHYHKKSEKASIPSNFVRYIYMDSNRQLWLSTESEGLYRLDPEESKIVSYSERHELKDNKIVCIEEDSQKCLWMGTLYGLYKYNPNNDSFVHFGKTDNFYVGEFNYQSCAQDNEFIYMGAAKGLVWFNPREIVYTHKQNPIYFERMELLNHSEEQLHLFGIEKQPIILPYNSNFFTIFYTIPDMLASDKIDFSCYMEGFEDTWQQAGNKRRVSYTNVPPGDYMFYVKSTGSSGLWNDEISSIHIIITPPWWHTWWAWCLWILLILGSIVLVFVLYRHELNIKHLVQLKEIEKNTARDINEAKLRFYTNITHELRTPVFLITAPLEELMSDNKRIISVSKSYLMSIYRNAMKLNKMITRMIDLRKLEQGKLKLDIQSQNVVSFCRDLLPDYEALCHQKNIVFHFIPEKSIIKLAFDPEKLEIILTNLVSNAFKYTPDGGRVALVINETENGVVFTVEDNGIGIEKKFQQMVFDRFFQIDPSHSVSSGDGIGLSFVKHLVELHGGTVKLESEPGKGSKFMFTIPVISVSDGVVIEKVDETTPVVKEEPSGLIMRSFSPAATHTILLIDDEPEILDVIERLLIEKFRVLKADNGVDGLYMAQQEFPDLIICDVMMPKMDGMAFLIALKENKELSNIPIIMLTAKSSEDDQIKAFDMGADAFLTKPVSLKLLRNRIDSLLSQKESLSVKITPVKNEKAYSKEEQNFLLKCKDVIDDNLTNPDLGVVFLAEKIGMSHSSFYRKIKSVTGMSGMDFINEYRIFKALQLFNAGETNVGSVGMKCGFNDIKTFRDAFKKKMNMSPKQYVMKVIDK